MKKLEYKNGYIKMQSEQGLALFMGFKMKRYLVVSTFFNPLNFVDFYKDIEKIYGVYCLEAINVYDDGTGYLIFLIDHTFNKKIILDDIDKVFADHFFNNKHNE